MLIKELLQLNESAAALKYISISKKIGAYVDDLPQATRDALLKNKKAMGYFTFTSDIENWTWSSKRIIGKPSMFSDALALAAKEFKRRFDTEYVTLKVSKADVMKLTEGFFSKKKNGTPYIAQVSVYADDEDDAEDGENFLTSKDLDAFKSIASKYGKVTNAVLRASKMEIQLTVDIAYAGGIDADEEWYEKERKKDDLEDDLFVSVPDGYSLTVNEA